MNPFDIIQTDLFGIHHLEVEHVTNLALHCSRSGRCRQSSRSRKRKVQVRVQQWILRIANQVSVQNSSADSEFQPIHLYREAISRSKKLSQQFSIFNSAETGCRIPTSNTNSVLHGLEIPEVFVQISIEVGEPLFCWLRRVRFNILLTKLFRQSHFFLFKIQIIRAFLLQIPRFSAIASLWRPSSCSALPVRCWMVLVWSLVADKINDDV